jgi:hypothetical protein
MKSLLILLIATIPTLGDPEVWTDSNGRTAEMELVSVSNANGVTMAVFRLKNGKEVTLDSTKLAPNDARKLAEWKPVKPATKATFIGASKGEKIFENSPAEDSASFRFSYTGQNVIGVKKNSLTITFCNFTGERKVRPASELSSLTLGSPLPIISQPHNGFSDGKTAWHLSPLLTFNNELNQNELSLHIYLKHEKDYSDEEVTNSKFGASLIVGVGSALKTEVVKFKKSEIGKRHSKTFHSYPIWLEEQSQDPFQEETANSPKVLAVFTQEPYEPGCVKSCQLISDGKPIRKASEADSEISVTITYWSSIKKIAVECVK